LRPLLFRFEVTIRLVSARPTRLRERKKQRTRETIERVALELFATRGYQATTLTEIADAAEIAPSTLHSYFPAKEDIVFSFYDAFRNSARIRLLGRRDEEPLVDAIQAWISTDLPALRTESETLRRRRAIIESDPALVEHERLHLALIEDVFAEAFARDLGEEPNDLRSRLMASVTVSGLRAIWLWWYGRQTGGTLDSREPYALDARYLVRVIQAAEASLEGIPSPQEYFGRPPEPFSAD
jgi:AcrR family transcriptional regulator